MINFKNLSRTIFKANLSNVSSTSLNHCKPLSEVEIVIIGAGLAGLSAANHLIKNGFKKTIVLEATDRYGGRINSIHFGDAFCELGAKWVAINASKGTVYDLLRHMSGLPKKVLQSENKVYVKPFGERVDKKLPELINILYKRICSHIKLEDKYKAGDLHDLNSVHTYFQAETSRLVNTIFKGKDQKIAKDIFNSLFKEYGSILGCSLEYVNIEHITKIQNHGNNSYIYIPTGLDNVISVISKNLNMENMKIGKPVGVITWHDTQKLHKKSVVCIDGSRFSADHIICTLPLGVLKCFAGIMFKPLLPKEKLNSIKNLGFGSPVKIYFEYDRNIKSWFKSNLRPLWSTEDKNTDLMWTKQIVEISNVPKSNRVLEVMIGGAFYNKIEKLSDDEVITEITKVIRNLLKNVTVPYPTSILRSNWSSLASYLGGRPYFSIESTINDVKNLAAPLGDMQSLLFAGDATILNGFGTVDGARMSGIREAQRIIEYYRKTK